MAMQSEVAKHAKATAIQAVEELIAKDKHELAGLEQKLQQADEARSEPNNRYQDLRRQVQSLQVAISEREKYLKELKNTKTSVKREESALCVA